MTNYDSQVEHSRSEKMASRKVLIDELKKRGLPTYGTIVKLQERLNAKKEYKLTIAILQDLCRLYGLKIGLNHNELRHILAEVKLMCDRFDFQLSKFQKIECKLNECLDE